MNADKLKELSELKDRRAKLIGSCISCGSCADTCPISAISQGEDTYVIDADTCISCGSCAEACPVQAISDADA